MIYNRHVKCYRNNLANNIKIFDQINMPLKLSIDAIETIDAISRQGSFSAAASELHKVPSALTYQMKKLEKDLDVSLFNRDGYRTTLTEAGKALLTEGRQLLEKAHDVETHVKRIATGIEPSITIAVTDLFQMELILETVKDFYAAGFDTHIKITKEVYGGSWDALASNRADISVGAPGDAPVGGNYATKDLGEVALVFAVASHRPLANVTKTLENQDILPYRIAAVADSSKNLPARTSGILTGQEVLTVPDMQSKLATQLAGLAIGYLPKRLVEDYVHQHKLVIKNVSEPKAAIQLHLAWRKQNKTMGPAQTWLIKQLSQHKINSLLLKPYIHDV